MGERVRAITFERFRGLPKNRVDLKGRSLVLLGANGRGKSALVDGIEFVFSGSVGRFRGVGTGAISHDDAITNVRTGGDPKVILSLSPSNGDISRELSSEAPMITERSCVKDYFDHHSSVDAFVLRRAKILEFICDQDANRYSKFVRLLGITKVDTLQRRFVDVEQQVQRAIDGAKLTHRTNLAGFYDPLDSFAPKRSAEILIRISKTVETFELEELDKWGDAEDRLSLLKAKRPEANREKIDAITRALVSIETPLALSAEADVATANELRLKLNALADSSADAPRSTIIDAGLKFLHVHQDETHCPLCEVEFEQPFDALLTRLRERSDALQEFREAVSSRKNALARVKRYADEVATRLKKDLEHSLLLDDAARQVLRNARASALCFSRRVARAETGAFVGDLAMPDRLPATIENRKSCAATLREQKAALVPPDSTKLEAAIALLERGIVSHEDLENAEQELSTSKESLRRATIARNAFTNARESAIQQVFTAIAGTVLEYYRRLHGFDVLNERSECTDIELKPTSRAAAGGLSLAIQFLGLADSKDPQAFLSEGHLDSLGLCLFLAAARIFNPPGSLLVLDDVLTSIDKEHRRRVGELLFSEFQDFQIILTTHDEHWRDLLRSTARARGLQDQWRYLTLEGWTVETGPTFSIVKSSWDFITEHLTEGDYRNLGGPLRLVLEDFLKRTAAKIELRVKFKSDGNYTAGDFDTAGIQDKIRDLLIERDGDHKADILADVGKVFGQGNLLNFLSHDNPGRLDITFDQAKDFVSGLQSLTSRCQANRLIKGR